MNDTEKWCEEEQIRLNFAMQRAAGCWCEPTTRHKPMDPELAIVFACMLRDEMYAPHLGCATTRQLFDELRSRMTEPEYTTVYPRK